MQNTNTDHKHPVTNETETAVSTPETNLPPENSPLSEEPQEATAKDSAAVSAETSAPETSEEASAPEQKPEPPEVQKESENVSRETTPGDVPEEPHTAEETEVPDETEPAAPDAGTAASAEAEPEAEFPAEPAPKEESASDPHTPSPEGYKNLGLYLHIPFCKSKCAYCDFYSTDKIQATGHHVPKEMKLYCKALKNHMRIMSERTTQYNVDTIFIGGGTPTALPAGLLVDLVKEVKRDFYLDDHPEFTIEMNPATADLRLLKKLRKAGVNRLSIGLQSAHDHELAALSRIHTVGDFAECFQMAREAGFDNINVDVMYHIPEQTTASFFETLEFVCSMKPEHISMYSLIFEPGTPFAEKEHMLPLADEDDECEMYYGGIDFLAKHGYHQYEISNFARDGYECRHNLKYWHGEEYIGCGPASYSYFGGRRFGFERNFDDYCKLMPHAEHTIPSSLRHKETGENPDGTIDRKAELCEYLMLRLRLNEGISETDFKAHFGADFEKLFGKRLQFYIDLDLMKHENGRYFFTPQGMFKSNYILSRIIPFDTEIPRFDPGH